MSSTFLGVEIGKRSLLSHHKGLSVIGHNVANANNKSYSRQRISLQASDPIYEASLSRAATPGQIGQGVEVASIRRDRDIHLEGRINIEIANREYWKSSEYNLRQVEDIIGALESNNLQEQLDTFWSGWQNLSINPSEPAVRTELLERGIALTQNFKDKFRQLNELKINLNEKIRFEVEEVNTWGKSLAALNVQITQSQALGDNPNDLLDKRDELIQKIASKMDVKLGLNDADEIMLFVGGKMFVQGDKFNALALRENPNNEAMVDVYWKNSGDALQLQAGSMKAHLDVRDVDIKNQITKLDSLAYNLSTEINSIHSKGFDAYNRKAGDFFTLSFRATNIDGSYDLNDDGTLDSTLLFKINGSETIDANSVVGSGGIIRLNSSGNPIEVAYREDDTLKEVIKRVNNANGNVNLHINTDNKLVIKANADNDIPFAITYLEDTGNFLTGITGVLQTANTPYSVDQPQSAQTLSANATFVRTPAAHPSGWMEVNENIVQNAQLIASSSGIDYDNTLGTEVSLGNGDGKIALEIASLRTTGLMVDDYTFLNEFYVNMVTQVASQSKTATEEISRYDRLLEHLGTLQQSVAGVNIDEEMANMVSMQYGYQAAAKFVSAIDQMLEVLMRTG